MENARYDSPLTPVALAYAGACVVSLALLPRLESPLKAYGARHAGALLAGRDPLQGILLGIGVGAAAAALGQAFSRWTPWGRLLARLLARIVGGLQVADSLLLAALSGFGEELVFRGLLLPYLGFPASSILFGVVHLIPRRGLWPFGLWACANGFLLGWLALATGGLLAPAVAHFLVNAVGLLLLSERTSPEGDDP